jgi:hypothetical protein
MRTTVRRSSRSRIAVEKVSARTDQRAFLRRRGVELVTFDVAFTGSGERAAHPAPHAATADPMRTSVRQNPLPLSSYPVHAHLRHSCLPSQGHTVASWPHGEAASRLAAPHHPALRSPTRFYRLSRSVSRSGCVGVCGPRTHPCESLPRAHSLAAHTAVQQPPLPLLPRPSLP